MRGVDELRHEVTGKLLLLLPWSPMQDLDLAGVPTDGAEHELTMYMEDTMWPIEGKYPDYVEASGTVYAKSIEHAADPREPALHPDRGRVPARVRFAPATRGHVDATDPRPGAVARLADPRDRPRDPRARHVDARTALQLRDQWDSKLLRTSSWSPLH